MLISAATLSDMPYYLTVPPPLLNSKSLLPSSCLCWSWWANCLGGSLVEAAVVRAAMNFSYPLRVGHVTSNAQAAKVKEIMETIQFSGSPNVILETIKRGEDDDDVTSTPIKKRDSRNLILRIYEAYGGKGTAKVTT
jgi:alpha-mannosidase